MFICKHGRLGKLSFTLLQVYFLLTYEYRTLTCSPCLALAFIPHVVDFDDFRPLQLCLWALLLSPSVHPCHNTSHHDNHISELVAAQSVGSSVRSDLCLSLALFIQGAHCPGHPYQGPCPARLHAQYSRRCPMAKSLSRLQLPSSAEPTKLQASLVLPLWLLQLIADKSNDGSNQWQ